MDSSCAAVIKRRHRRGGLSEVRSGQSRLQVSLRYPALHISKTKEVSFFKGATEDQWGCRETDGVASSLGLTDYSKGSSYLLPVTSKVKMFAQPPLLVKSITFFFT